MKFTDYRPHETEVERIDRVGNTIATWFMIACALAMLAVLTFGDEYQAVKEGAWAWESTEAGTVKVDFKVGDIIDTSEGYWGMDGMPTYWQKVHAATGLPPGALAAVGASVTMRVK